MEKKKTQLRKVRAQYLRGKRQSHARSLNHQFTQDTRRFYAGLKLSEAEEERPRKQGTTNNSSHGNGGDTFENIEETRSFYPGNRI